MHKAEDGIITAMHLNWQGKILLAYPAPRQGNRCTGCVFRDGGLCSRPKELYAYSCVDTLRADRKDIVWISKE